MLDYISQLTNNNTITYKNNSVPIYRLDSLNDQEIIESEEINVNRLPKTFLYFKDRYYPFEEIDDYELFWNFMDRVFEPIETLKTKLDVEHFRSDFDMTYPKSTRVIALISSKSEYKQELKELYGAARVLSYREDLQFAKLTNSRIIKDIKKKYPSWFSDVSSDVLVSFMKNRDSDKVHINSYDLSMDDEDFVQWINDVSLAPLEELTVSSLKIILTKGKPIFTAYVDLEDPKAVEDSEELIDNLRSVAKSYPQFIMTYTKDSVFKQGKSDAGIDFSEEPALALNPLHKSEDKIVFPRKQPYTKRNLKYFFKSIWEGTIKTDKFRLPDTLITYDHNMKESTKLTLNNYEDFLKQPGDKYVLMFDSTHDYKRTKELTKYFGKTAIRFKELELNHIVKLGFFDTSLQDLPDALSTEKEVPLMRFYPDNQDPLEAYYPERTGVQQMMKYAQKHSTKKFDLPAFPHFSPHEFSQDALGNKIKYEEVIVAENKRKEADEKFEKRQQIKNDRRRKEDL